MQKTEIERAAQSPEMMRIILQERAILEVTERICQLLDEQKISRREFAKRLEKSPDHITQMLDGEIDMSIRGISDMFFALGRTIRFSDDIPRENDCLLIAAPDLLAACKDLSETMWMCLGGPLELAAQYGPDFEPPSDIDIRRAYQRAADAITKATQPAKETEPSTSTPTPETPEP